MRVSQIELLHVDDLARAAVFLLEHYDEPEPINVGTGTDVTIKELAELVAATVGFADLSHLARLLEHALMRSHAIGSGTPDEARLFVDSAEEIRRLLHQFAAGFLKAVSPELLQRLADHDPLTDLWNRRRFGDELHRHVGRCQR